MKTLLKILLPFFIALGANAQSVFNIQGDTIIAKGFGTNPTLFQIKNNTAYRTGGYLQNYLQGRTKWNYAIDSAYSLGGVLYLVRSTHDTIPIAISGTVGVSSVAAGFGTDFSTITTTGSVKVDSFVMATRLRVQKQIDSLGSVIGVGSVTSVAAGFGTSFSTITSTGSVIVDSFTIATRLRVKKQIDSLSALLSSYVPVARTITSGFGLTGGTQDLSANRTISTDSFSVATRARLQKSIDSLDAILSGYLTTILSNGNFWVGNGSNVATSVTPTGDVTFDNTGAFAIGSSKVTNTMLAGSIANNKLLNSTISGVSLGSNLNALSNGYGITTLSYNGSATGSANVDSFSVATRARVQKPIDSLGVIIATKGVGSVTSVAAGYGLNFTTITGSGSVISDTFAMATRARVQKPIDSLGVVIATKGSGTVTNVGSGFGTVFSAITTTGNVIIDSFTMATRARVQKPIDSLDAAIVAGYVPVTRTVAGFALSSNVTLASLTQGYGLAFSSGSTYNASTGITERVDTALMSTIANRDKLKDSLGVVISGYVPITRTVNGKALSSNITLSLASADFANQGTTTTVLHGNGSGNPSFGSVVTADITDANITYAKIQNVTTQTLVGRYSGTNGVAQEITIGSGLTLNSSTGVLTASGGGGITISSTTITSGTNTRILYNNSGVVGEYTLSGSGSVAMTNGSTITNTIIGGTLTLTGNTYNSGDALVGLAIDTLTGIVYRKTASGGGSTSYSIMAQTMGNTAFAAGVTNIYYAFGTLTGVAVLAQRQNAMPVAGTIKKLYVRITRASTGSGTVSFYLVINGVDTGLFVSDATCDGTSVTLSATTDVSFSAGDLISIRLNDAQSANGQINSFSIYYSIP